MDFTNVTKALTARGFKVSSFETAKEAAEYLNSQIDGATVGFGGSITLEELGLYALLSGHNTVFSHWHLPEGADRLVVRVSYFSTDRAGVEQMARDVQEEKDGGRDAGMLAAPWQVTFYPDTDEPGIVEITLK